MSSPLRPVLLTCGFVIAALTVSAAPRVPDRPRSVRVFVDSTGITPTDNGSQTSPKQTKVWARAGGNFAIVVENLDTVAHTVTVPNAEFKPAEDEDYKDENGKLVLATEMPMVAGQNDKLPLVKKPQSVTVKPGEVGVLLLQIQPLANFGFDKRDPWKREFGQSMANKKGMTYKYTIHSRPEGKEELTLDPDVEITPP